MIKVFYFIIYEAQITFVTMDCLLRDLYKSLKSIDFDD